MFDIYLIFIICKKTNVKFSNFLILKINNLISLTQKKKKNKHLLKLYYSSFKVFFFFYNVHNFFFKVLSQALFEIIFIYKV